MFVPSTNERVGMNDQGRPSGSPETAGAGIIDGGLRMRSPCNAKKDIVGARHCLALIRRRLAPPTISQARLAICLFEHERARRHERPRATQWVAPTLGHNVGARHASPETAGAGIIDGGLRMRSPYNAKKDIVGARHCLALIRRRLAPPTISQARLAICLFRARTSASA